MSSSPTEERLCELLLRWDDLRHQGREVPAEELCGGAPELLAELHRRIEVVRAMDSVLETESTEFSVTPPVPGSDGVRARPELPGVLHASAVYRPERRHAEGGLGEILAARQEELDRLVALKRIRPDKLHAVARQRFLREAAITARLQHPGIVPIYGLGQDDDGPFYTMPLIQGQTLHEAIQAFHGDESLLRDFGQRSLSLRRLLQRFLTVCDTVAYAHDQGVVHRDLKPLNIMLGPYGETLVMDWGLAKPIGVDDSAAEAGWDGPSPSPSRDDLTATGAILGTPQYMSPEQAQGLPAVPASDVFSLGLILYAILTGKPAFDDASFRGADPLKAVRDAVVLPPRHRDPRLSRALEAVCLKALAALPADRYASARDLAGDLENWLAGEPVTAWREPWAIRARRWVARHRTAVATTAASSVVAAAASGYFVYDSQLRAARQRVEANDRVDALLTAQTRFIPAIVSQIEPDRPLVADRMARLARSLSADDHDRHLRLALALLADQPEQAEYLLDRLLRADSTPNEVIVIRGALLAHGHQNDLASRLWSMLDPPTASLSARQLRVAAALALFDPADSRWRNIANQTATKLIHENPLLIGAWREIFEPVRDALIGPLLAVYNNYEQDGRERDLAFALLFDFATQADNPRTDEALCDLIAESETANFDQILRRISDHRTACNYLDQQLKRLAASDAEGPYRQGRIAAALIKLGEAELAWPLYRRTSEPTLRTELIDDIADFGIDPEIVLAQLLKEPTAGGRRALILALGGFAVGRIPADQRDTLFKRLVDWYRTDPDPGVHGAADWLLRRWGYSQALVPIVENLMREGQHPDRDWFVNRQGQTFSIIRASKPFLMGSPDDEPGRETDEVQYLVEIPRSFAIATREVTFAEYQRFLQKHAEFVAPNLEQEFKIYISSPDCPAVSVEWHTAIMYCNYLSEEEGIPESEWFYPKDFKPKPSRSPNLAPELGFSEKRLNRRGYRLPTEAEWEFVCRAGSVAVWPFGRSEARLTEYAWVPDNSKGMLHPVAQLKPNELGVFDMLGNAWEWVHDPYARVYQVDADRATLEQDRRLLTLDGEKTRKGFAEAIRIYGSDGFGRMKRGGCFQEKALGVRSARRGYCTGHRFDLGFRVVRTVD